jgi:hypothetical protein
MAGNENKLPKPLKFVLYFSHSAAFHHFTNVMGERKRRGKNIFYIFGDNSMRRTLRDNNSDYQPNSFQKDRRENNS